MLAPVLDLDVEPRNPIVGTRSFGADPQRVGRLARAWIEACQGEGAAACAKHFPGHGRTTADSHDVLPRVAAGRAELEVDVRPFAAVADVVASVMTAHVAYPALGSERPATLEPAILEGLLRDRLGFEGIVVTDAMNMSGFADAAAGGPDDPTGAAAALLAGCDLLLYPADLEAAAAALDRAATHSTRVGDRVEASLRRLEETARRVRPRGGSPRPSLAEGADPLAEELARDAVRVVGTPPAWLAAGRPVRVATVWDDRTVASRSPFGEPFREALRARGWRIAGDAEAGAPVLLLVASTPQGWKGTASLTAAGRASVVAIREAAPTSWPVALGHARLLPELGDGGGLVGWGTEEAMERAAAARLDEAVRTAPGGRGVGGAGAAGSRVDGDGDHG
ncbi:MAG: glycoside hydrolase family 3 N-terminal domain-containing protein [Gemmatimonadota bacterium]